MQYQQQEYKYDRCMENGCSCTAMIPVEGYPDRCAHCSHDRFIHVDLSPESNRVNNEAANDQNFQNNINLELNSHGYPVTNEVVEYGTYPDHQAYLNQISNSAREPSPNAHQMQKPPVRERPPPNTIWFYNRDEKYYEFTNFKEGYPILAALVHKPGEQPDYRTWSTSEHLFQAAKFKKEHPELCERIRLCKTARDALNMARQYQHYVDPNWQDINIQVMEWVVTQKFEQHQPLALMLLSTGDCELVEHTEFDSFWGDGGGNNKGRNELGNVLMRVRQKLREKSQFQNLDYVKDNSVYMMSGARAPSPAPVSMYHSGSDNLQNLDYVNDNSVYMMSGARASSPAPVIMYYSGSDNPQIYLNNMNVPPPPLPPRNIKRDMNKIRQLNNTQQQQLTPQQQQLTSQQQQLTSQQQIIPQQQLTSQQQIMPQQQITSQQPQQQIISQQQIPQQHPQNHIMNNDITMGSNHVYVPPQYNNYL